MANYGQQINFVACLTTNVVFLLTGSRGGTRTHDTHRMKVLHWPLCYSTDNFLLSSSNEGFSSNLTVANNNFESIEYTP